MVPVAIFGALYLFLGILLSVLLVVALPSLSVTTAILFGAVAFLAAMIVHVVISSLARLRDVDQKLFRLRIEMNDVRTMQQQAADDLRDMNSSQNGQKLNSVMSEMRIMQSVIDKVLQADSKIASNVADPVVIAGAMNDKQILETVREAIRTDRIDIFTQPIVSLPQRKLRFYEIFSRIRTSSGETLTPDRYLHLASDNEGDIIPALDNLQLLRCIQMLRDSERRNTGVRFFCNIASSTLRDGAFMTELVRFLGQNSTLASKLVFELAQSDLATLPADIFPLLDGLGRLGCRFSMDNVYSLDFPITALQARKIRFVKIDAQFLLAQIADGKERALSDFKTLLDRNSIDLICARIESEDQLREILDLGIDFGQGYLFGEPRADWPLS